MPMLSTTTLILTLAQPIALNEQPPLYGGDFTLKRSTIDSSGGPSSGGQFSISGTVGQPDAGRHSGGQFLLKSGFWTPASAEFGVIFADRFEN